MKTTLYLGILLSILFSCSDVIPEKETRTRYNIDIGNIEFDAGVDNSIFRLCDSSKATKGRTRIHQAKGNKWFKEQCLKEYKYEEAYASFSGFIVVRFMINCKKETGRYRTESLDFSFQKKECPEALKAQLITLTKELSNWKIKFEKDLGADFSKYINFKFKHGKIESILY